jgi:hypothetical protein
VLEWEGPAVNKSALFVVPLSLFIFSTAAAAQAGRTPGGPPFNGNHELMVTDRQMPMPQKHTDPEQLRKLGDDLASAANAIPSEIESVRKGMLPKDLMEKLKRIEKLSKQLRDELKP